MANNQIKFGIGFNVDKTGLNQIRAELQQIANMTQGEFLKLNTKGTTSDLFAARRAAEELDNALNKAFNKELGTLNVAKFNQALKTSDKTIDQLYADLSKCGIKGQQAFRSIATEALTTNRQLKQTHNLIDKMAETMGNTIKWGVASSVMNSFTGSVQKAYGYVKNLDRSLNDIRIVTGKSVEDMDNFAERASKASKALAASTTDYTEAALIYYQQGLADKEVQTRAETTLKAANVTGQSGQEVSEQLTAVWNGYKVSAQETELYVDKLAAVAATTASDLEELSTGMSKVASAANAMGVDIDQLNGHLSTVISVTRQAPESVGTAFKTIYARLGDLAVSGEDEFGTSLGEVSGKLKQMGIEILDSQGQMRDMGTVMEEVAEKWNGWTDAQRQAAAVAMAGKRQYNNLIALFDNWDMYTEAVNTSANAMGTLQNQQNIYMDSTKAHLDIMKTSFEDLYDSLLSGDDIETFADAITKVVNGLTTFVDSIGGGVNTLMLLGSIGTKVFSKQLAQGIGTTIANLQAAKYNANQLKAEFEILEHFKGVKVVDVQQLVAMKQEVLNYNSIMTQGQHEQANNLIRLTNELNNQKIEWESNSQEAQEYINKLDIIDDFKMSEIVNKDSPGAGAAKQEMEDIISSMQKYQSQTEKASAAIERYQDVSANSKATDAQKKAAQEGMGAAIGKTIAQMNTLAKSERVSKEQSEALTAAIKKYNEEIKAGVDPKTAFKNLSSEMNRVSKEVEEKATRVRGTLESATNGATEHLKQKIKEAKTEWESFTNSLRVVQVTQHIINLASGIGSLASGLQSLTNIKNILNNEDLSSWEKALQITTALASGLTMLGFGAKTISSSLVGLSVALGKASGIITIQGAEAAAAGLANEGYKVSLFGVSVAAETTAGAIGKLVLAFMPYIAIAGAVIALGVGIHKWYTKDARAAEEAAEAAQKASEAANSVKEAHQGVIDTLNKYDSATEKMNSLTKGTQEWRDALNEANTSVLELLNTFPELASGEGYFEKINGQLKLTEEGLDYIKEKSESMLTSTTAAANIANVESQKANINSDITNLSREIKVSKSVENYNTATGSSTTSYATTTGLDKEVIEKAIAAIQENGSAFLSNTSTIMEVVKVESNVANALKDNSTELIRLANNLDAIEISEDLVYEQIAASALQDKAQYQGLSGDAQGAVNQMVGDELQAEVEKLANSTFATMTDANEEAAKQFYGAQMSKEGEEKGTTDYLINGEWKTFADDVTLMSLATQEATNNIDTLATGSLEAAQKVQNMDLEEPVQAALLGFSGGEIGDLSNLNIEQLKELENALGHMGEEAETFATEIGWSTEKLQAAIEDAVNNEKQKRLDSITEDFTNPETYDNLYNQVQGMSNKDFNESQRDALNKAGGMVGLMSQVDQGMISQMISEGLNLEEVLNEIDWSSLDSTDATNWFKNAFETAIADAEYSNENEGNVEANFSADAEQYGFEEEDYRDLTGYIQDAAEASDEYADALKTQEDEAQDVAKALLRYDKGIEAVNESGEDWLEMLEEQNDMEIATNIDDIADAYGNVLDMDPSVFSEGFLKSAENMKLMQAAAEGSEDAYNELMQKAQEDIIANCDLNTEAFDAEKAKVDAALNEMNFKDLEIGANLDTGNFLTQLENMVNEAGMTAEQAQAYLSSMGIDAEIEEAEVNSPETNESSYSVPEFKGFKSTGVKLPIIGEVRWPEFGWKEVSQSTTGNKQFKAHSLKVTAANKSSGGGFKYKNTKHGGGTGGKKSSGGGGGRGGGGGSTPTKSYKTSDAKKDPFHDVDNELSKLNTKFDRLTDNQDRLYGKNLLDNLNKQLDILNKIVDKNKEKLKIAKDEVALMQKSQKNQRKGYFNDLSDFGVKFNSKTGEITNYETIIDRLDAKVKKLHDKWNSLTAKQQEGDAGKALEKQIEQAEANRDTFEELVDRYDTYIYETIPGLEDTIREAAYQQIEIEIKAFKVEGQLYLDMSEALEQLKDFKKSMNEYLTYDELNIGYTKNGTDLALGGGSLLSEALISEKNVDANLDMLLGKKNKDGTRTGLGLMGTIGDGTDSPVSALTDELTGLQSEYEKYRQDPENYRGKFAKEGEDGEWYFDEAGFREAMQETSANLEEEIKKVEDAYKENREALLQSIDLIGESYAQQMETYDFINDRIESQIEAAKLLNGEADYAGVQGYYEQASANAQAKANTAKEEMKLAYNKMNDPELSAEEREKWKAMYEESVAEYEDASFAAIEAYKAENENFVHAQADAAFGTDAEMDLADAQWEIQTALDDKYLDSIDKAYETQKLSRKLQQDMDGASLAAQKKLAKFRDEELEKLKEKDKLTQYDVDRANKLYEIELKKIALEEAQQNKSKMRLRRDSSGNYSYQFVADEEKTAEMEQKLEDAQYGLREMDLEHQRELQEEMLQMQKDYKEKWIEYNLLSEEEQKAREAEYSAYFEYYQGELTAMSAQALETQDNLKESSFEVAKTLYSEDETNFKDLTDAQKLALQDKTKEFKDLTEEEKKAITEEGTGLMPTWNTAVTTMIDKFSEGEDSFKSKVTSAQTEVDTKQAELNGKIKAAATGIQTVAQNAEDGATEKWLPAQKQVNEKLKKANERLSKANKLLEKQRDWWKKIKEKASEAIAKTQTYLALTAKEEAKEVGGKGKGGGKGKNQSDDKKDNGKNNNKNNEKAKKEKIAKDAVEIIEKVHYGDIPQNSSGWAGNAKKAGYSQEAIDLALKAFSDSDPSKGFSYNYKIAKKLVGLKTGGYTGQGWSSKDKNQGKVALLHEKELILNANDTANMLEMIRLTRELFAQQNSLTKKSDDKSNLEKEIQEAREAYKKVWAEYNSASASDRDAKAQEYEGLRDQLRELTRVQEEAKAASQLEYENALAQLEEQKLNVRNSIEVAKHLQDIASKQEGRLTASDIATSFEQVLSNQNKAFSNIKDVRQNKIVDGLNMTIEKVMEAMNNNLQNRMNATDQMMNTLKDSFTKEKEKSLDQTVYVNAEFPNASKVEDIEKALNNLVNRASQKANSTRKKR